MDEGEKGFSDGGVPADQFHRNEAISAVADEGFLGEEEDDDYEDLYNDVNVRDGFLQSLRKNEDLGFKHEPENEVGRPVLGPATVRRAAVEPGASIPGSGDGGNDGGGGERKFEQMSGNDGGARASGRLEGFQNVGFRGNEMSVKGPSVATAGLVGSPVGGGMRVELARPASKMIEFEEQTGNSIAGVQGIGKQTHGVPAGNVGNEGFVRQVGSGSANGTGGTAAMNGGGGGGGTILFVGDLHWWTTDAELEAELCNYGVVKDVKFFDEKASGKSKGYCQVEFYDHSAATACKEGMNGHIFNGRPCVVAHASPFSIKRMGEAQINRNQQMTQNTNPQSRRGPADSGVRTGGNNNNATGGNYQGGDSNNRGYGRGNWGRGNAQGMGNRGPVGPMRNRPSNMGGRGIIGNGGNGFGQGIAATPPLMHPQAMMGQGFDPAFGAPMGRMGNYGGFPTAPNAPFSGIMPSFPPVGGVGLPGVAPHVNPAFFGRGMAMNGMGMMPTSGVDTHSMGMWSDPSMGGWTGEEHGGRAAESSYGDEGVSDHQYGDASHDRGVWPTSGKEKDRGSERDYSGFSDRRHRDEREPGFERGPSREKDFGHDHDWSERRHRDDRDISRDRERERERDQERSRDHDRDREHERGRERDRDHNRERYREDRDRYTDHHRYRDREAEYDDERDRGRSARSLSKSLLSQGDDQRSRSRDVEYGKRRRLTSE